MSNSIQRPHIKLPSTVIPYDELEEGDEYIMVKETHTPYKKTKDGEVQVGPTEIRRVLLVIQARDLRKL